MPVYKPFADDNERAVILDNTSENNKPVFSSQDLKTLKIALRHDETVHEAARKWFSEKRKLVIMVPRRGIIAAFLRTIYKILPVSIIEKYAYMSVIIT